MALTTAKPTAEELGISTFTLYRCARAGLIPVHRLGRAVRFDITEVRAALRQNPAWNPPTGPTHPKRTRGGSAA